jgi:hypothetical protein
LRTTKISSPHTIAKRLRLGLLLVLPGLLYLSAAIVWHARGEYRITGDEPHYLLIADSIVRDHDLRVRNNYLIDTPVQQAAGLTLSELIHLVPHTQGDFSRHNIGLPLLLALPYSIGGVFGARIFLALVAGLAPFLIYRIFLSIIHSEGWSAAAALVLTVGLPFVPAANQIFPDVLAGLIILFLTWRIFFAQSTKSSSGWLNEACVGLVLGFLPWLHLRFAPPAILLLAGLALSMWDNRRDPRARRLLIVSGAMLLGSLALLLAYNRIAFSSFAPYSGNDVSFHFREIGMISLGLHWDQSQGMFVQQPLLLLGLMGIASLVRQKPRAAIFLGLLYLSVLIPSASHPAFYGGPALYGRFWWAIFSLWIFPMAYAIKSFLKANYRFLPYLLVAAFGWQAWLASRWFRDSDVMRNHNWPVWAAKSLLGRTRLLFYLPTFRDIESYLIHPANYVAVLGAVLLIITGWFLRRAAWKQMMALWILFLVVAAGVLALVPPAPGSWKINVADLPSQVGRIDGVTRIADETDGPGIVIFGPYTMLTRGNYDVSLDYETRSKGSAPVARFDIVYDVGARTVADMELEPDAKAGRANYNMRVLPEQSLNSLFEFRVKYTGQGFLRVNSLTITPAPIDK